ncbi:MAG: stalk domain-containing protein [Desulfocucumaceae bacterium]
MKKSKKFIALLVILMMLPLMTVGFMLNAEPTLAVVPYDQYSIQAMQNSYKYFAADKAVDGAFGNFGAYEAYILTMAGADLSTWVRGDGNMKDKVLSLIDATIAAPNALSAKKIAAEYLMAKTWGEAARAGQLLAVLQGRQTTSGNGSFDSSPFSDLPALEMLGRAGSLAEIDEAAAITYVLADQTVGTGAWSSTWNDIQATAQAVRALKYLEPLAGGQTAAVQAAITAGANWLHARQQVNGSFLDASSWDDPLIDTAEAILTMDLLGLNLFDWNVAGISALDYMQTNAKNADNTFGTSKNLVTDIWALDSYGVIGGTVAGSTILGIKVSPATATVIVGNTQQYTAAGFQKDGTTADISATAVWSSNNTGVATVSASGLVTGEAAGNAVVTAALQGAKGTAAVAVVSYDQYSIQALQNSYGYFAADKAIDGVAGNFGAYEAYILTMAGADLSTWVRSDGNMRDKVLSLIDATIAAPNTKTTDWSGAEVYARSAKKIAAEYLMAKTWSETARAGQLLAVLQGRQTTSGNGSFDKNAFSDLPALEMLGRAGSLAEIDEAAAITYVLANKDGATGAWSSTWNDIQATAQAVRALKYLKPIAAGQEAAVDAAITAGANWLQARQQANGSFLDASSWDDPLIDTAEAIMTMDLLGISFTDWNAAGVSALDYMQNNAKNADNTFGTSKNLVTDVWALDSYGILGGTVAGSTILGIKVSPATASVMVGITQQYTAAGFQKDGTTADISAIAVWTSSNTGVATVSASGLTTGAAAGNAVVTAALQGAKGTAAVVVSGAGGGAPVVVGTPISVKVVGRSGETLYAQNTVYLKTTDMTSRGDTLGITPAGALHKTGLSYDYDSANYINTVSGQGPQGMNGWMYRVNGVSPGVSSFDYTLNANDQVLWFYSTDSANIAGLDPTVALLLVAAKTTAADLITAAIEKEQDIIISLENRENMLVEITPASISQINELQKEMTIVNTGLEMLFSANAFATEQLQKALAGENSSLQIGAKEIATEEKETILAQAKIGQSSGLFEIGGKILNLTAQVVTTDSAGGSTTEKISSFSEPVRIIMDLSALNLTAEEIAQLTAIRYEIDTYGQVVPVKLGGSYDATAKTLTFYTEHFSYYGVARAEKLVTVGMGINMLTTTVNGQQSYTDVPPIIINERTMVPVRFIAENFGAEVQWTEASRTVNIELVNKAISLVADKLVAGLDTPAMIKNGRLLVPLRFVSESLGARVTWFPSTQRIEIVR